MLNIVCLLQALIILLLSMVLDSALALVVAVAVCAVSFLAVAHDELHHRF